VPVGFVGGEPGPGYVEAVGGTGARVEVGAARVGDGFGGTAVGLGGTGVGLGGGVLVGIAVAVAIDGAALTAG
jgi:hypothetical protein